jgi:hypothetical protein
MGWWDTPRARKETGHFNLANPTLHRKRIKGHC